MIKLYKQIDEFLMLFLLLLASAILIYFVPVSLNRIIFLLFLILIWISKKNYFWYAFILLILEQPGGLFSGGAVSDPLRLPVYNLYSGVSFSFEELYIFLIFLKPLVKNKLNILKTYAFKRQFQILGVLLIILLIVSLLLGISFVSLNNIYKTLIKLSLYFSAIFIFYNEEDIISFFRVLFPFVFIAISLQLYGIVQGQQLVALFKPNVLLTKGGLSGELMRPIEMSVILLVTFFGSFLFLGTGTKYFSRNYLMLINVTAFLGILMTATRSWFLGFSVMYLFYFFLNGKFITRNFSYVFLGIVFAVIILLLVPKLTNQIKQAATRLETLEELAVGDITAGGTLSRITVRGPKVMEGFKQSTILFGAGFSNLYFEYADGHVGYQNILLNSGIIGSLLLFLFAFKLYSKPYSLSLQTKIPDLKYILRNLPLILPAILIINSGTQFWGFNVSEISRVMLLSFYFSTVSTYLNNQKLIPMRPHLPAH